MTVVLPTPEAGLVSRFAGGDENALVALYRDEYESLLSAAAERLGHELVHYRGRVAHKAMLETWQARERFENPVAFNAFLEEAVRHEADIQRRKHAALHHREGQTTHHVSVRGVDDAVRALMEELHAPEVDHAQAAEEARAMKRQHAKEHVERVAERPRWLLYGVIALVVLVAIGFGERLMERASVEVAIDKALKGENAQALNSGRGQRGTLTLRDDTQVRMGSDTRLVVPAAFATSQRTVQLEGTAVFTVSPTSSSAAVAPFAVRAGSLTITAQGTVFAVRNFAEDGAVTVEVTEGRVEARDREGQAVQTIDAGQAVRFAGGAFSPLDGEARDVALAWTRDSIVFVQAPLGTVVPELVRWFSMNAVLVDPSVKDRPVSMRIALNSSGEATKALTEAADLVIDFGKNDRIEFKAAPEQATKKR
jgi:ferric-dicitrate binding protein FerR (iron transport regulator)